MKSSMYENPVRLAIILDAFVLYMTIGSILDNQYNFTILLIMLGVVNNKIINKGKNLNQKKKNIIHFSLFLTMGIFLIFALYMHNVRYR
ncbi:hypothetical protein [Clostridium intestinale]|uniref:hypothetical protein n=1 Tax=Clostridium intestinale TaxID=36845 RepID=UPI0028EF10F5|nr:hypothetical protein [Clostridium intestinale]